MYTNPTILIGTLIFVLISCTPSRPIYNKPAKNNGDYVFKPVELPFSIKTVIT